MAESVNLDNLRFIIDGYQGTVFPLNRTSLREVFDEVELLRAKAQYLESRLMWNASEVDRLRAALLNVKEQAGAVCAQFEVCTHPPCQASYAAWAIADEALRAPTAPSQSAPSPGPSDADDAR